MTRLMSEASIESDHTLGTKTCTKCGKTKPRSEFYKQKDGRDGLQSRCKLCANAETEAWKKANPDKVAASSAAYYEANHEKVNAKSAAWAKKNPDRVNAKSAAYRKANRDKVNTTSAAWKKSNPDKCRIINHNRRARKLANGGTLSPNIVEIKMREQNGLCPCCGMPLTEWHLDHNVPLSRGGPNTDDNMQLLLPRCNLRKGTKTMQEYMQHLYKQAA